VRDFLRGMPCETLDMLEAGARAELARRLDNPEGFAHFYQLVYGRELPRHALEEWLPAVYRAKEGGRGIVIEAFALQQEHHTADTAGGVPHRAQRHKSCMLVQGQRRSGRAQRVGSGHIIATTGLADWSSRMWARHVAGWGTPL